MGLRNLIRWIIDRNRCSRLRGLTPGGERREGAEVIHGKLIELTGFHSHDRSSMVRKGSMFFIYLQICIHNSILFRRYIVYKMRRQDKA